jgi:hypothetical protein
MGQRPLPASHKLLVTSCHSACRRHSGPNDFGAGVGTKPRKSARFDARAPKRALDSFLPCSEPLWQPTTPRYESRATAGGIWPIPWAYLSFVPRMFLSQVI